MIIFYSFPVMNKIIFFFNECTLIYNRNATASSFVCRACGGRQTYARERLGQEPVRTAVLMCVFKHKQGRPDNHG